MKYSNHITLLLLVSIGTLCSISFKANAEAFCPPGIPTTANDEEFELKPNGEVLHLASNLVFMRCSIGQTWDGAECLGDANTFTWKEALNTSIATEFAGQTSWRLPNIKELSVILERACVRPAINETIFPNTPSSDYWTNTPNIYNQGTAWSIAFSNASNSYTPIDRSMHIRLVRPNINVTE